MATAIALVVGASGCAGTLAHGAYAGDIPPLQPFQVRTVQRELQARGFPVDATGTWDESTRSALAAYQASRHLPATGLADRATLFRLGVDPDPMFNCETNSSIDCGPQGGP